MGRTGRAGLTGAAHTLVTVNDKEFAGHLVRNLESSGQVTRKNILFLQMHIIFFAGNYQDYLQAVSKELYELAMQSSWFKNSRFKGGKGKVNTDP